MKITNKHKILLFAAFFLLIAITALLSACSASNNNNTKSITDTYGRKVNIPNDVQKIATVGSATRYCVYAGAENKLIAITDSDKPNELKPYTIAAQDSIKNLPSTNNGNHINATNVDKEKLVSLKPDVIISSRSKDECDQLQNSTGIPVVGVYTQDKIFDDEVYNAIKVTSIAAGTEDVANKKIDWLKGICNDINNRITDNSKTVYRGAVNFKGSKNLCGTISNYCIYNYLKLNNVAKTTTTDNAYDTNLEQILNWNPDYIFMDFENKKLVSEQINQNIDVFNQLKAFKNNNIYFVAPFNNNGTNIEYGICELYYTGKITNPDKYFDIDLEQMFANIIKTLDGKDIYQNLKQKGIVFDKASF